MEVWLVTGSAWKILSGMVLVSTPRGDFACHHLLVCNAEEDSNHVRLLSALDIAKGLLARSSEESWKEAAIMVLHCSSKLVLKPSELCSLLIMLILDHSLLYRHDSEIQDRDWYVLLFFIQSQQGET